jgi:mercuric reductase
MRYDMAIIGSGAAAFAAAITARAGGHSVVMVERAEVGGTCVNTGCVPSKALLTAAGARHAAVAPRFPGVGTQAGPVDFPALIAGKDDLVAAMRQGKYLDLASEHGWRIIPGQARFVPGPGLHVAIRGGGSELVDAAHYLVATGSAPWVPPVPGLRRAGYLTAADAAALDELPQSLIVLGGGATGLEQSQMFARLGARVDLVEALDRLAPAEEPEISAALTDTLADEGVHVHTASELRSVTRDESGHLVATALARLPAGAEGAARSRRRSTLRGQDLLLAAGRRAVTGGLDLAAAGVRTGAGGAIPVDGRQQTSNPRIWAAGDVTAGPQYVYAAAAQGTLAAENALGGGGRALDYTAMPRVIFTDPAVASVGLTEAQAVRQGRHPDCRTLPLRHVPRAVVNRETRGLVKLVAEAGTGRLLGAHAVADGAGEVITTAGLAITGRMTVTQLAGLWCPYLTMTEALKLAAQSYSTDVSRLSCCAA